jgi:hypothetical protein
MLPKDSPDLGGQPNELALVLQVWKQHPGETTGTPFRMFGPGGEYLGFSDVEDHATVYAGSRGSPTDE